jgi:hypothetical protein
VRFLFLLGVLGSFSQADQRLLCRSSDFKPHLYIGQGLDVVLSDTGEVLHVLKMTGSEFCDEVSYATPPVFRTTAKTTIYNLDFPECTTWNEHLAVPMKKKPTWMRFEFTWSDGLSFRRERIFLTCKRA